MEVARFICVQGEYLSEEVLWTQINHESLTRPSAPTMVGGRCQDDYQQGRVVELLSSEGSSSVQGGDGGEWGKLASSRKVGIVTRCVGVLAEMDTSINCSPQLEGAGIFQPGVNRGIEMNQFDIKFCL